MFIGKYINDERTKKIKQQIQSEAFMIVIWLLLGSILVKRLVFNVPIQDIYVEFGIMMVTCCYVIFMTIIKGAYTIKYKSGDTKKRKYIRVCLHTFIGCMCSAALIGLIDYFTNGTVFIGILLKVWPVFTLFPLVISGLYILFDIISSKAAERKIRED